MIFFADISFSFSTSSTSTSGTSTSITSYVLLLLPSSCLTLLGPLHSPAPVVRRAQMPFLPSLSHRQLGPRKCQCATRLFQLTNSSRNTTPASPATLSSSSSRTPGIIGGVIGGLIALAILVVFFLVRSCLIRTRESDQLPRFQKFDRHPVTSGRRQVEPFINTAPGPGREKRGISGEQRDNVARLQVEPFTNTAPGPGREKRGISGEQGDNVARLQVQLRPVTPPQESPFVVELHRRIQELAEIVCPPDYAEAPNS